MKNYKYFLENKQIGVCMKLEVSGICLIVLTVLATTSLMNFALAAFSTGQTTTPSTTQIVYATGNGWINPSGKRDDLSFYCNGETLKTDGWRYNPHAQTSFTGKDFKTNQAIQVWSTNVWRFKIDSSEKGKNAIIVGTGTVKIGQQELKNNWWFRITTKEATDSKDAFMIQLWRPTGANNVGGWSPQDFKVDKPGSLHLNAEAFYQVQGVLKGGNIVIKP